MRTVIAFALGYYIGMFGVQRVVNKVCAVVSHAAIELAQGIAPDVKEAMSKQ